MASERSSCQGPLREDRIKNLCKIFMQGPCPRSATTTLREPAQSKCTWTHKGLCENLQEKCRGAESVPWSNYGLISYRKNPSVFTHCLGKHLKSRSPSKDQRCFKHTIKYAERPVMSTPDQDSLNEGRYAKKKHPVLQKCPQLNVKVFWSEVYTAENCTYKCLQTYLQILNFWTGFGRLFCGWPCLHVYHRPQDFEVSWTRHNECTP